MILEKKKGVQKKHVLKIIGLLEADFNTALIFFSASQMIITVEENSLLEKHHGLRNDQTHTDATMIKLLTFECAMAEKSTKVSYDRKACFDRVEHFQSNIYAQK